MKIQYGRTNVSTTVKSPTITILTNCAFTNTLSFAVFHQAHSGDNWSTYPTVSIVSITSFKVFYYNSQKGQKHCWMAIGF